MYKLLFSIIALTLAYTATATEHHAMLPEFLKSHGNLSKGIDNKIKADNIDLLVPEKDVMPPKFTMIEKNTEEFIYEKRLTRYTYDNQFRHGGYSINWDEYGFPDNFTRDFDSNHEAQVLNYVYEWKDPGKIWSSKLVEERDYEGNFIKYHHDEIRTFHSNGSVASCTLNSRSDTGQYTVRNYDENGFLIKEVNYRLNEDVWTVESFREFHYLPYLDEWVVSCEDYSKKIDVVFEYNGYITITYGKNDNGDWIMLEKEGRWYGEDSKNLGFMFIKYNEGSIARAVGSKTNFRTDDEGNDVVETMVLNINDNGEPYWEVYYYSITTSNFNSPWIYNPDEKREKFIHNGDNYEETITYTWVNPVVVKEEKNEIWYGSDYITYGYFYIKDENLNLGTSIYFDESTGDYVLMDYEGDSYITYTFFDINGNQTKMLREHSNVWEQLEDSKWVPCTDDVVLNGCNNQSRIFTFDDQGRILSIRYYNDGNFYHLSQYIYHDDGHEIQSFILDEAGELTMTSVHSYIYKDDSKIFFYFFYDEYGNITDGYKEVYLYEYNGSISYDYNKETGTWDYKWNTNLSKSEVLDDGTIITIIYTMDRNCNMVLDSKKVEIKTDYYRNEEFYRWNNNLECWNAITKNENIFVKIDQFTMIYPTNPLDLNDDYFVEESPTRIEMVSDHWNSISYRWDNENGWNLENIKMYEVNGQTLNYICSSSLCGIGYTTITIDNDNHVVEEINNNAWYELDCHPYSKWEYDNEGVLICEYHIPANEEEKYTYTYSYDCVPVSNKVNDIEIGSNGITVYNLQGIPILRGASEDSLLNLDKGIYIINHKKIVIH